MSEDGGLGDRGDGEGEGVRVKVMTLNCWGIWGVSAHRVARMRAIAHHLVQADYDIVMLQEVPHHRTFT